MTHVVVGHGTSGGRLNLEVRGHLLCLENRVLFVASFFLLQATFRLRVCKYTYVEGHRYSSAPSYGARGLRQQRPPNDNRERTGIKRDLIVVFQLSLQQHLVQLNNK
jgi:hypothetical protein